MIEPHSAFATIAEVVDANHYGIVTHWGQRLEAVYYRTGIIDSFDVGDRVFIERAKDSQVWIITAHVLGP